MRDNMRKGDFEHLNEESNGNSSDEEENQLPVSGRKGDDENLKEKDEKVLVKRKTLEDVSVGQKVRIEKYNEEVMGWTPSSKNPERPPDNKKTKEENRREKAKIKK